MKGWLGDTVRMTWALLYWNARKSAFVLKRRRGRCPCHHPSDSGRPMETACEAVLDWRQPARFQRVCPLLTRNSQGTWVCRVSANEVRPFWVRAFAYYGGAVAAVVLLAGFGVWGALVGIGYHVTPRQVFWPPAWRELKQARVQLFIDQARSHYQAGRVREAIAALAVAHELAPDNYPAGMMLAQFYQAGNPDAADTIYLRLSQTHPENRNEIARTWFRSLLARGRLADVVELSRRQLAADSAQAAAWTHALIFSARVMKKPDLLAAAAADPKLPSETRAVLQLEAAVRTAPAADVHRLLLEAPLPTAFPYAREQRTELLIEFGYPQEALGLLAGSQVALGGRDVVRLALDAMAKAGDHERVRREASGLLAPTKQIGPGELTVIAQHLIRYPDSDLLATVVAALSRIDKAPPEQLLEVHLNLLCATGVAGDKARFATVRAAAQATGLMGSALTQRVEDFFFGARKFQRVDVLLVGIPFMPLDVTYLLLERYLTVK
ncbi:MAG TPA: tetratricopeptide repeat protein [Candidatus Didemnitutus sp.]|nr:tetratricopeptide repeat protein [Candidatus Didemnitutus sp.]